MTPPEHIIPANTSTTVDATQAGAIPSDPVAPDAETLRRVRLSSQFDLILTAIVPDPEHLKVEWDFAAATSGKCVADLLYTPDVSGLTRKSSVARFNGAALPE